uniref:Glycosyltransferase n=1 Tax=Glycyrrhiza uralensis TaxID=74613 RepID=A0A515L4C8_GLYUR|nr:UDP-glycosyltransferase UGT84F6 [Glycyrrhiza uralensis]
MGSESESPVHILLVSYPAQGHINPLLRLGKCLAAKGSFVIFVTTEKAGKDMRSANNITDKSATPVGDGFLMFEFFEDGLADDDPARASLSDYSAQLELVGKQHVSQMIKNHAGSNTPISCVINNPFLPWVCDVAAEHGIPSALMWIQSSAVFTAYYNYFHKLVRFPSDAEPYIDVQLPSLVLKYNEIPDFLHPFSPYPFLGTLILEQFKNLSKAFCVLVDTYEELERDFIDHVSKFVLMRPVGPLFKNQKATATSNNIRGDFVKSDDCIEWLNSRSPASVVYISFGSIVHLPQEQVDEIAYGLLSSKVSFLWVLKPPLKDMGRAPHVLPDGFFEETSGKGKVVQWSPQEEVLAHPSVACFLTHCGWNSSMEALTLGVPMLTFPAWGDQVTNAKFLVDVFGVGIRLGYSQAENKVVNRDEVKKCLLEATVGPKAEELKQNALKWKKAAEAAVAVGGSSDRHLDEFIADIKKRDAVKF